MQVVSSGAPRNQDLLEAMSRDTQRSHSRPARTLSRMLSGSSLGRLLSDTSVGRTLSKVLGLQVCSMWSGTAWVMPLQITASLSDRLGMEVSGRFFMGHFPLCSGGFS